MAPIEGKVKAGTAAAALSGLLLWAAGRYVFKGSVPDVVTSWVYAIIPALITFGAGYLARHTPRPGLPAVTPAGLPGIATLGIPAGAAPAPGTLLPPIAPE